MTGGESHVASFISQMNFCLEEAIYLFAHRSGLLWIVVAHRLFDELCIRKNLQFVLGEFPGDAWHICWTPGDEG
jgi:hypothetical protein